MQESLKIEYMIHLIDEGRHRHPYESVESRLKAYANQGMNLHIECIQNISQSRRIQIFYGDFSAFLRSFSL